MCVLLSDGNWNVITQVIRREEASPWTCLQQGSWLPPGQVVQERKRESSIFYNLTSEMTTVTSAGFCRSRRLFCNCRRSGNRCPAFPWPDQVPEK